MKLLSDEINRLHRVTNTTQKSTTGDTFFTGQNAISGVCVLLSCTVEGVIEREGEREGGRALFFLL